MDLDFRLIGSRVKAARRAKGMTQQQLAEKLDFSAADSVGHIECGRNKPSLPTLIRIAQTLDVSLDYLTGFASAPHETLRSEIAEREALTPEQEKLLRDMIASLLPFVKRFHP